MNVHKNARLTAFGRERIARHVANGQTPKAVGEAAGVCPRTVRKWVVRYRREGSAGLKDRSSRPHRLYRPTPPAIVDEVRRLRRQRYTGKQIAAEVGVSHETAYQLMRSGKLKYVMIGGRRLILERVLRRCYAPVTAARTGEANT